MRQTMNNIHIIGYCSECTLKIESNEEYKIIGKKLYHKFCYDNYLKEQIEKHDDLQAEEN